MRNLHPRVLVLVCGAAAFGTSGTAWAQDAKQGLQLQEAATSKAEALDKSLDALRKKIHVLATSPDPEPRQELEAIDDYIGTATRLKKQCELVLSEEPTLRGKFSDLRIAYGKTIEFYQESESKLRRDAERAREDQSLRAEQREKTARKREDLADIYKKLRDKFTTTTKGFEGWERNLKKKFKVVRAKLRLLNRTLAIAELMRSVAVKEAETKEFVEQMRALSIALERIIDEIAKVQEEEAEEGVEDK